MFGFLVALPSIASAFPRLGRVAVVRPVEKAWREEPGGHAKGQQGPSTGWPSVTVGACRWPGEQPAGAGARAVAGGEAALHPAAGGVRVPLAGAAHSLSSYYALLAASKGFGVRGEACPVVFFLLPRRPSYLQVCDQEAGAAPRGRGGYWTQQTYVWYTLRYTARAGDA